MNSTFADRVWSGARQCGRSFFVSAVPQVRPLAVGQRSSSGMAFTRLPDLSQFLLFNL